MNAAWVAKAIPPARRRKELSFRHHSEVAALPPETADQLLDWCLPIDGAKKPRTVRELRAEILRRQTPENPASGGEPPPAEEKPSAELQETTTTLNTPRQEPLGASVGGQESMRESLPLEEDHETGCLQWETAKPSSTPAPHQSRYGALLEMLRGIRDDPPDPIVAAELAVAEDVTTLEPARIFFGSFYARLKARFQ
jgi:hypothetical protein